MNMNFKNNFPRPNGSHFNTPRLLGFESTVQKGHSGKPENEDKVLKAAKGIFSKKTRTLYHWAKPNLPKSEIKNLITKAWDSMPTQEKHYYISQAMGFPAPAQNNLMINPQLTNLVSLQNQSSTSTETNQVQSRVLNLELPEARRRRPVIRRIRKRRVPVASLPPQGEQSQLQAKEKAPDFPEDPELNTEIQKFINALNSSQNEINDLI